MIPRKNNRLFLQVIFILIIINSLYLFLPLTTQNIETNIQSIQPDNFISELTTTDEGSYNGDINWVKTRIDLANDGKGSVMMIVNCTPTEAHFGIYLRPIVEGVIELNPDEIYAINANQTLSLNYSSASANDLSYRIYLDQPSLLNENETIQYYFSYNADFFVTEQIQHFEADKGLISLDFNRPYWDGDLDYQELEITFPIDVGQINVTQAFLDEIKFDIAVVMVGIYDLINSTKSSAGNYWLVINFRKEALGSYGSFQTIFYLSTDYFKLPAAINWLVGLLVSLIIAGSITMLFFIINVRKKTKVEVEEFKSGLHEIVKTDDES